MAAQVARLGQRLVDGGQVVAVDDEHPGAERRRAGGVAVQVPAQVGGAALAEPVDVDDRDQVGQLVVRGLVQRLPDGALGHLAVAAQGPDPVRHLVQVLAGQRHAHRVGQPLPQRAGGHVDPGQHRGRVPLQPGPEPPVPGHQLLVGDDAGRLVDRVQQGRSVALGEDQVVVGPVTGVVPVIAEVPADQDGQQVGGGHAGGRVPRPGRGARPDGVHAELLGEFGGQGEIDVGDWREFDRRARDAAVFLGGAHLGLPAGGVRNDATIPAAAFRQGHPWRLTLACAVPGPARIRAGTRAGRLYRSPSWRLRCGQGDGAATAEPVATTPVPVRARPLGCHLVTAGQTPTPPRRLRVRVRLDRLNPGSPHNGRCGIMIQASWHEDRYGPGLARP